MIIAKQKPLQEIRALIGEAKKVLVAGCGTCVTVCFAGDSREASILASSLRMSFKLDKKVKEINDMTVQRQCEWEFPNQIEEQVQDSDLVLSLGCGIGDRHRLRSSRHCKNYRASQRLVRCSSSSGDGRIPSAQ